MKGGKFILAGIFFGIVLTKSEVISWFRIQEMFRFQSFHMYGVIGSAVILGILVVQLIKRLKIKSIEHQEITIQPKPKNYRAALLGGTIFGLGWAMTGACPGPLYILVGNGYWSILIAIGAAILGTLVYGIVKPKLPH